MKPLLNGANHGEELSGPTPITVMTTWRDLVVNALQENHQTAGWIGCVSPYPEQPAAGYDADVSTSWSRTPRLNQQLKNCCSGAGTSPAESTTALFFLLEPV